MGYLPKAIANYLSRVGHTIADNDLKTLEDLALVFETQNISSSPSKFDMDQLLFWQKKTVESLTVNECKEWLEKHLRDLPSDLNHEDFIELVKDNINFLKRLKITLINFFINL